MSSKMIISSIGYLVIRVWSQMTVSVWLSRITATYYRVRLSLSCGVWLWMWQLNLRVVVEVGCTNVCFVST